MNNEKLKIKAELAASIFHDITKEGVPGDDKVIERTTYLTNQIIDGIDTSENREHNLEILKSLQQAIIMNMSYGLANHTGVIANLFDEAMKSIK